MDKEMSQILLKKSFSILLKHNKEVKFFEAL